MTATVRLTPARRDKLRRLGAKWLGKMIDMARAEKTKEISHD